MEHYAKAANIGMASGQIGTVNAIKPISQSESILSRVQAIRDYMTENRTTASNVADKIVGASPAMTVGGLSGGIEAAPTFGFLDAVNDLLGETRAKTTATGEEKEQFHAITLRRRV